MNRKMRSLFLLLSTLLLIATGCIGRLDAGPTQTDSKTVELGSAESARVDIKMGIGQITVDNGAGELMEADFTYNVETWKPEVDYEINGDTGRLTIRQPNNDLELDSFPNEDVEYEWDVKLNDDVPMDLDLVLGVGESYLELGDLNLTGLNIQVGVGEATIDLAGDWTDDVDVDIRGGVGETTIILPRAVGARVHTQTGIGSVNVQGLTRNGNVYVNDAYEDGGVLLDIEVQGGVGSINLRVEE